MEKDYIITIIQNEKPPLSDRMIEPVSAMIWILVVLGVLFVAAFTVYAVCCLKYKQRLLCMAEGFQDKKEQYWGVISYHRLKEWEQELEYEILEQNDDGNFLKNLQLKDIDC